MVHSEIGRGNVCAFWEHKETTSRLAADTEGQASVVRCVVDVVNRTGNEGCLSAEHVEGRFGESVVNVTIVSDVDAKMACMVAEFKIKPHATHIARTLVGDDGVESKERVIERGLHTVLKGHAGRETGWRDFDGRRLGAVVLYHGCRRGDGVSELAAFQCRIVGISLDVRCVNHGFATAHCCPNAAIDLLRTNGREIEARSDAGADAKSMENWCGKSVGTRIKIEFEIHGPVISRIDVPEFNDVSRKSGHRRPVLAHNGVVVSIEDVDGEGCSESCLCL